MMSDNMYQKDHVERNVFLGFAAFLMVGASAIYGYSNGYFSPDVKEIVQQAENFKRCDIKLVGRTVEVDDDEYSTYYNKTLKCELTDVQKSTTASREDALDNQISMNNSYILLPSHLQEKFEKELIKYNAKKFQEETIKEIAVQALEFDYCEINSESKSIACSPSHSQKFMDESGERTAEELANMNLKLSQLNDPSKVSERIKEINQQRSAGMEQLRENVSRLFGIK